MKKIDINIGYRIRGVREELRLSREAFSELSGISPDFISDIENGKKDFTVGMLKKLCKALNIDFEYIICGTENQCSHISFLASQMNGKQRKIAIELLKTILSVC
ncbi:MAG: helix-turn-helix domain-containing protein [Oscillospiraceae bacterium]|nr:helix-turn-helix domain-containing protein [Oscillospiraceae bacterium]